MCPTTYRLNTFCFLPQWFGVIIVLLYRFFVAAFCFGWLIGGAIYYPRSGPRWFIYLSNWSFFFVTLYFICATIVTAVHYKKHRKQGQHDVRDPAENDVEEFALKENCGDPANGNSTNGREPRNTVGTRHVRDDGEVVFAVDDLEASRADPMAWFHEALWVIYNIAAVAATVVTLSFWLLIFRYTNGASALSVVVHGVNSIVMVGDTMLSSIPVRLFHVVYPMLYSATYIVFTVIYWAFGGTNSFGMPYIYPQTDYTGRPVLSAVSQVCLFFIGLPLCQSVMFGFYGLRVWMKTKCGK